MTLTMICTLIVSTLLMIISFFFSLQANVWIDALYRSFIVFIASFILSNLFIWLAKKFIVGELTSSGAIKNNDAKDQQQNKMQEDKQEEDTGKHIDIQTPDDEEFIPFQPRKVSEDEWKKK